MTDPYHPHRIQWTRERVAHLWDYHGARTGSEALYFSVRYGRSLLRFVEKQLPLRGHRVLDFGCGHGALLRRLLEAGIECLGVEFSARSAAEAARRVGSHPRCLGITQAERLPTSLEDGVADTVVLVEVVEHLFEEDLGPTLAEIRRLLRPGGHLVVTTPHAEDLEGNLLHCPECGATFHQWQHLRSFDTGSLTRLMSQAGFETVLCQPLWFRQEAAWPRRLANEAWLQLCRWRGIAPPHLVYIGRAPVAAP